MDQIILDSYFLVGLYIQRFREISLYKLQVLLFLTQAESLIEYNDGIGFYPKSFNLSILRSI